jgi:hypothetical protein
MKAVRFFYKKGVITMAVDRLALLKSKYPNNPLIRMIEAKDSVAVQERRAALLNSKHPYMEKVLESIKNKNS